MPMIPILVKGVLHPPIRGSFLPVNYSDSPSLTLSPSLAKWFSSPCPVRHSVFVTGPFSSVSPGDVVATRCYVSVFSPKSLVEAVLNEDMGHFGPRVRLYTCRLLPVVILEEKLLLPLFRLTRSRAASWGLRSLPELLVVFPLYLVAHFFI